MGNRGRSAIRALGAAVVCVTVAAGCGGGSDSATVEQNTSPSGAPQSPGTEQPLSQAEVHGRDLFVAHCGACHTLDAAGTVGNVGPNLGDIAINEQDVLAAIRTGGGRHAKGQQTGPTGTMPPNLVTGKDAQDVAAFVAANAGGSSTP
ncbi:MAG TPA: cytochrome c [Solirubrobacterales bacterium]|nr:cytochrome c [Solirubrobacterales bacterium]